MLRKLSLIAAIVAALAFPSAALAQHGGHGGGHHGGGWGGHHGGGWGGHHGGWGHHGGYGWGGGGYGYGGGYGGGGQCWRWWYGRWNWVC